jgi:hypothetical protein
MEIDAPSGQHQSAAAAAEQPPLPQPVVAAEAAGADADGEQTDTETASEEGAAVPAAIAAAVAAAAAQTPPQQQQQDGDDGEHSSSTVTDEGLCQQETAIQEVLQQVQKQQMRKISRQVCLCGGVVWISVKGTNAWLLGSLTESPQQVLEWLRSNRSLLLVEAEVQR